MHLSDELGYLVFGAGVLTVLTVAWLLTKFVSSTRSKARKRLIVYPIVFCLLFHLFLEFFVSGAKGPPLIFTDPWPYLVAAIVLLGLSLASSIAVLRLAGRISLWALAGLFVTNWLGSQFWYDDLLGSGAKYAWPAIRAYFAH